MNLPQALTLVSMVIGISISISINLLKRIRQIEKANRAYRDALWEIRFCNEGSPTLTYQAMEAIALKALTENETERYPVTLTENKKMSEQTEELEDLVCLAATTLGMLEGYLGPQWFDAVHNLSLDGPDKVAKAAAIIMARRSAMTAAKKGGAE